VNNSNNSGIWAEGAGGELSLVVREGNQASGTPDGVDFSFFFPPVLNGAGRTAFRVRLDGTEVNNTNNSGIWSEGAGGELALVAREGDQAPGTPDDVNFSEFSSFSRSQVLNAAGQAAFLGDLTGTSASGQRTCWVC